MKKKIKFLMLVLSLIVTNTTAVFAMDISPSSELEFINVKASWFKMLTPSESAQLEKEYGAFRDEAQADFKNGLFLQSAQKITSFFRNAAFIAKTADVHLAAKAYEKIGRREIANQYLGTHFQMQEIDSYFK